MRLVQAVHSETSQLAKAGEFYVDITPSQSYCLDFYYYFSGPSKATGRLELLTVVADGGPPTVLWSVGTARDSGWHRALVLVPAGDQRLVVRGTAQGMHLGIDDIGPTQDACINGD